MSLAMHNAAREGNVAELTKLLAQGSSVSTRDKHSRQPLHLSAWAGQLECCKVLVAEGADKGAAARDDTTALHFAAQKGHAEIARFLLNEGSPARLCAATSRLKCALRLRCDWLHRCKHQWQDQEGHDSTYVCFAVR